MNQELIDAIAELDEEKALRIMNQALAEGTPPLEILNAGQIAMSVVGERFEKQEYYLAELMMAGELLKQISDIIKPKMNASEAEVNPKGRIVIGTVRGDVHNIGKDIVVFMLEMNGYDVYDLGVDVPEEAFLKAVREIDPGMVCLSGLLTTIFPVFRSTIEALEKAGLRNRVKIAVGGGQVDEKVREYTGADGYGSLAVTAVTLANQWMG
ncbi:MAG: cobalamin-dependent protein [Clostridiales Family XIII bacterium]|jgi:5-methyltetrahydrofolate--homocysteine methyltransferase|nr:cobalamin-dependent protein [Clostridiales Family XIII bacterium]